MSIEIDGRMFVIVDYVTDISGRRQGYLLIMARNLMYFKSDSLRTLGVMLVCDFLV